MMKQGTFILSYKKKKKEHTEVIEPLSWKMHKLCIFFSFLNLMKLQD